MYVTISLDCLGKFCFPYGYIFHGDIILYVFESLFKTSQIFSVCVLLGCQSHFIYL